MTGIGSQPRTVLIIDDDLVLAQMLVEVLEIGGHPAATAATGKAARACAEQEPFEVMLLDLRLPDTTGLALLPELKRIQPETAIVMITADGGVDDAVAAMRLGADNFIVKPIDPQRLLAVIAKAAEASRLRRRALQFERLSQTPAAILLGNSPEMREALRLADSAAKHDTTVLLRGATGTGKGLLARRIHELSPRAAHPFVALNCAGLSRDLTESELFGHERGAFTGATERKLGLLEAAERGTLFLDEVGELDPLVQAKLLKVLEEKCFRRLGGVAECRSDVRLIAATHRDLKQEVAAGRFRSDLMFRLDVFSVTIPTLAERADDVLPLAIHFLREFRNVDDAGRAISDDAAALLLDYDWPGNVRELRNVIERASIIAPLESPILPLHLPALVPAVDSRPVPIASNDPLPATLEEAERLFLERYLRERKGSLRAAAKDLGINRGTLYRKARKYGIALFDAE